MHAVKWDSIRTSFEFTMLNPKAFSTEHITSSSHKHEKLEEMIDSMVVTQQSLASKQNLMGDQLKNVIARQYDTSYDLKYILELLKQNPRI